ncbi:MAG: hypothetical protein FJ147_08765 [Deltaproteobacteria bacterium]|nr:hypothetical protein [Deltaproteobacteria bacterium]
MENIVDKPKGIRQKSPNAPAYSVQEALEDARKIFRIENQVPISRESIAEHLSLAAQSGPFNRKLSSLRQYGFLEPVGKDLRVSDLFLRIDHSTDESDRQHALREALSRPTIFQGLLNQYETTGGGLPSDINLTNQLVLKHRFTKTNAETVAKSFLESARFAGLTQSRSYTPPVSYPPTLASHLLSHPLPKTPELPPDTNRLRDDPIPQCRQEIPLSPGRRAIVSVPEDVSSEEIAKVIRVLHALAGVST